MLYLYYNKRFNSIYFLQNHAQNAGIGKRGQKTRGQGSGDRVEGEKQFTVTSCQFTGETVIKLVGSLIWDFFAVNW